VALGLLGEYTWRALDEARGRPRYLIEDSAGPRTASPDTLSVTCDGAREFAAGQDSPLAQHETWAGA
jgi:hypothetical protein